jgi:hypothetical protein
MEGETLGFLNGDNPLADIPVVEGALAGEGQFQKLRR